MGLPMMATFKGPSPSSSFQLGSRSSGLGGGSAATRPSKSSPVPVPLMADTASGVGPPRDQKSSTCSSPFVVLSHLFTASSRGFLEWYLRIQP